MKKDENNKEKSKNQIDISKKIEKSVQTFNLVQQNQMTQLALKNQFNIEKLIKPITLSNALYPIAESATQVAIMQSKKILEAAIIPMQSIINQVFEMQRVVIDRIEEMMRFSLSPALKNLSITIEEALNNPDSKLNWINYYEKMSDYFWIMPYKMETRQLCDLLQIVDDEKEFDKYLLKYFNKNKVTMLINEISNMLTNNKNRTIFRQINNAYHNRDYILANMGIISMIDDLLAFYLINKGCSMRIDLFEPIIEDLDKNNDDSQLIYIVMMVNSNINRLYEPIEFNKKIDIKTHKKSRRHPSAHGKSYSNKRIDTVMLLNTFYYLLILKESLKQYKNCLYLHKKSKKLCIADKEKKKEILYLIEKKQIKI